MRSKIRHRTHCALISGRLFSSTFLGCKTTNTSAADATSANKTAESEPTQPGTTQALGDLSKEEIEGVIRANHAQIKA